MAGASQGYHEAEEKLSPETKNIHRALVSLQEELEAIDWYRQRADASENEALKAVLLHNMGEEVEHACMLLEWLRRHVPVFEKYLQTYLFQKQPITEIEERVEGASGGAQPAGKQPVAEIEGKVEGANGGAQPAGKQPDRMSLTVGAMKGA